MSSDPRKQRHHPPPDPSRWLFVMKVLVAIGQVVVLVKKIFHE